MTIEIKPNLAKKICTNYLLSDRKFSWRKPSKISL